MKLEIHRKTDLMSSVRLKKYALYRTVVRLNNVLYVYLFWTDPICTQDVFIKWPQTCYDCHAYSLGYKYAILTNTTR